jgi:hypothetical protein
MEPIDFYKLTRSVQERFIGSVNGTGLPAPILRSMSTPQTPLLWLGGAAFALVAVVVVYRVGYGDLTSGVAIQGFGLGLVYVALLGAAVFGALRAAGVVLEHKKSPFRRGVYVFPVGLIDARGPTLRMHPIEDLSDVAGPNGNVFQLTFAGKSFSFSVADGTEAETAKTALASARGKVQEADAARESIRPKALAALDPLQGFANPLMSSEPLQPNKPVWDTWSWAGALAFGVVFGLSAWAVHNAKSDDAMFAVAVANNDGPSYMAYLAKGSRHSSEVANTLLPRAELLEAEKVGTVAAIESFQTAHPRTSIGPEVAAALKAAMTRELAIAEQAGTLTALDAFVAKHPQSHLDAQIAAARHAVYAAALERYTQQVPPKSTAELAFVQHLVSWAEQKGPPVEIRFHLIDSPSLEKADGAVQKSRMFRGVVSFPSKYFDAAHEKPIEDALAKAIMQRFGQSFPTEILAFAVGEPISDPAATLPTQVAVPTLFIEHGPSWSGSIISSTTPRGVFVGLEMSISSLFRLPDDTKPLKARLDVWKGPDTSTLKGDDKPEETVYGKMDQDVVDQFQKKLLGAFFKSSK